MRKFWNIIKNPTDEAPDARVLTIDGEIAEESWWGDEVTPALFRAELNAGKGPVTVWINSPGGDCFAASQIYTMLREYPGEVTVKIDGIAASAASVIAMAGNRVLMAPTALLMIHNPATFAAGQVAEMEQAIEMLTEVKESIINAYEIKTGMQRAKLARLMDAETWMNAKKAIELGFADAMLEERAESDDSSFSFEAHTSRDRMMAAAVAIAKAKKPAPAETGRKIDELMRELENKKH